MYESGEHSHRTFFNGTRVAKGVTVELEQCDLITFGGTSRAGPDGQSIEYRAERAEVDQERPAPVEQEGPGYERAGARADGAAQRRRRGAPRDMTPTEEATLRQRVERFGRGVKRSRPEAPQRGSLPRPAWRAGDGGERLKRLRRAARFGTGTGPVEGLLAEAIRCMGNPSDKPRFDRTAGGWTETGDVGQRLTERRLRQAARLIRAYASHKRKTGGSPWGTADAC